MWRESTTFHVGCDGGTFQSRHARLEFRMTEDRMQETDRLYFQRVSFSITSYKSAFSKEHAFRILCPTLNVNEFVNNFTKLLNY